MKCRACGRTIDDNSRFCTYCDCDNYPEMNHVKTKGSDNGNAYTMNRTSSAPKYTRPGQRMNVNRQTYGQAQNNSQKGKQSGNMGCMVVLLIMAVMIVIFIASNL